jgi:dienelactone hydrolase
VIALHGCGGLYSARQSHRDALSARHRRMAEMLVDEGYLVLFPDSLRSRGIEEICSIRNHLRGLTVTQRRRDAQAALRWLQQRPDVIGDRIALVGWSHGGSTVLATLNQRSPAVASSTQRTGAAPYFHAAAAFYPSCVASTRARSGYALAAPLTMFVGGRDDWTAPEPCVRLAGGLAAAGEPVSLTVYPQAFHGFDGPPSPPRRRLDVPNGVRPGEGVTVAPDAAARDDAYAKLRAFLRQRLVGTQPPDGGANPAI